MNVALWLACLLIVGAAAGASGVKAAAVPTVQIEQEALRTALPRLGELYGVKLRPGRGLASQRVTLLGEGVSLDAWRHALANLLSHGEDGQVFWSRQGDVSILEASHRRAQLALSLEAREREGLIRRLLDRIQWAERMARDFPDKSRLSGLEREARLGRFAGLLLVAMKGEAGVRELQAGRPLVLSNGAVREAPHSELVAEWLTGRNWRPHTDDLIVLHASRFGGSTQTRSRFSMLVVDRDGFPRSRGGVGGGTHEPVAYQMSGGQMNSAYYLAETGSTGPAAIDLASPLPSEDPGMPKVALNLAPVRNVTTGSPPPSAKMELHTLLRRIHRAAGTPIVADGYLRPRLTLPANLEVRDTPVERLVSRLATAWEADYRTLKQGDQSLVVVRAQRWWSEDAADVPQKTVDSLARKLHGRTPPDLDALVELAQLSERQIYRLTIQTDLAPGGVDVIHRIRTEGDGAHHFLRCYGALPAAVRTLALKPPGLLLPPDSPAIAAVNQALLEYGGVHRPELLTGLRLRIDRASGKSRDGGWAWKYTFFIEGSGPSKVLYGYSVDGASPSPDDVRNEYGDLLPEGTELPAKPPA